jgi:hypothetical protein
MQSGDPAQEQQAMHKRLFVIKKSPAISSDAINAEIIYWRAVNALLINQGYPAATAGEIADILNARDRMEPLVCAGLIQGRRA